MPFMQLIYNAALVILVFMGLGIILQIIRPRMVIFFLMFLLFLPYLFSAVSGSFQSLFAAGLSWKGWLIAICVGLVALRMILNSIFRR